MLFAQAAENDTLDVQVLEVTGADSLLTAAAGVRSGVGLDTRGVVYLNVSYLGVQYRNRVARGYVVSAADSTCRLKILESTAPVRPGYRVLLFGLRETPPLAAEELSREAGKGSKPFYRRRWFWIAGGAAAATAVLAAGRGGGKSASGNQGTVTITGSLP